jgi:hypothetical protein
MKIKLENLKKKKQFEIKIERRQHRQVEVGKDKRSIKMTST